MVIEKESRKGGEKEMPEKQIIISTYKCNRCDHKWLPRSLKKKPLRCPNCGSPYWNTPRVRKIKNPAISVQMR